MYWIKIKEISTDKEQIVEFKTKKQAQLYRDYHCFFDCWDKKELWVAEKFLTPNYQELIVDERIETHLDSKKEIVYLKYYKIKPKFIILDDNLGEWVNRLQWDTLREERNKALKDSDYIMLADVKRETKEKGFYREYREYLRNLPLSYNESSIENYKIMTFEEWKLFYNK